MTACFIRVMTVGEEIEVLKVSLSLSLSQAFGPLSLQYRLSSWVEECFAPLAPFSAKPANYGLAMLRRVARGSCRCVRVSICCVLQPASELLCIPRSLLSGYFQSVLLLRGFSNPWYLWTRASLTLSIRHSLRDHLYQR